MKEVIINSLKGVAIGDAFGVGIEFQSRPWIKENVHFDTYVNKWKDGKNNISPGTYSDDTEHTIGVVEALLSDEPFSIEPRFGEDALDHSEMMHEVVEMLENN